MKPIRLMLKLRRKFLSGSFPKVYFIFHENPQYMHMCVSCWEEVFG